MSAFVEAWRRKKSAAFDLTTNSTARTTIRFPLFGEMREIYANANLSIYSAQPCNARCAFCVEELRPLSRGGSLAREKRIEHDDRRYFDALESVLDALRPLGPTVSITGGEPSKDPRLLRTLRTIQRRGARKRTLTTNGSGLLDVQEGRPLVDWIATTGVRHLNVSRAHPDPRTNAKLMALSDGLSVAELTDVVERAKLGGTRVRLSCVLLEGAIDGFDGILAYLDFAESIGVDNVIFRQLMKTDPTTVAPNWVTRYCDSHRTMLEPLLERVSVDERFRFVRQIVGYYYYVEAWRYRAIDVVFEEADLAQLEAAKKASPGLVHELVFHPNARLCSTWQAWDGDLGPHDDRSD